MKTRQPPKAKKNELDRKEWSFGSIPESELEACFDYEYARELPRRSPQIRDLLAKSASWRAPKQNKEENEALRELIKIMKACFPDFPDRMLSSNWFPHTSWQGLNQELQSKLVQDLNKGDYHWYMDVGFDALYMITMREVDEMKAGTLPFRYANDVFSKQILAHNEYGCFAINWSYPNGEIERAFTKWLIERREDHGKRGQEKKRKTCQNYLVRLKWLGAMRVVSHYPPSELKNDSNQSLSVAAPYTNMNDLYKYGKMAVKLIEKLVEQAVGSN